MNRPVLEIPGYYYDEEKKKYFKIQGSTAPPSAAYSSQDVKKRQTRDHHEAMQAKKAKKQVGRVRRFANLEDTASGLFMKREIGYQLGKDSLRGVLAAGLVEQGHYSPLPDTGLMLHIEPHFNIRPCLERKDPVFALHMAQYDLATSFLTTIDKRGGVDVGDAGDARRLLFGDPGLTTSLSSHETEGYHASTWLSGSSERGIGVWRGMSDQPALSFGPGRSRGSEVDVFTSTAAPPGSPLLFAFGTSEGILTLDKERQHLRWCEAPLAFVTGKKDDYLALEFLSAPGSGQSPNTLLCGARSGHIYTIDLRTPSYQDNSPIQNPSTVTHIKQIDEQRILVPGLLSIMRQYDLRYLKSASEVLPSSSSSRIRTTISSSIPVLSYTGYKNDANIGAGFAVDLDSGLIAAAQESDNYHPCVQLFSIKSGHSIPSSDVNKQLTKNSVEGVVKKFERRDRPPRCIRWVEESEGSMKSLFVSNEDASITRYAWGDRDEEEERGR